jgi:hypothetical protein
MGWFRIVSKITKPKIDFNPNLTFEIEIDSSNKWCQINLTPCQPSTMCFHEGPICGNKQTRQIFDLGNLRHFYVLIISSLNLLSRLLHFVQNFHLMRCSFWHRSLLKDLFISTYDPNSTTTHDSFIFIFFSETNFKLDFLENVSF